MPTIAPITLRQDNDEVLLLTIVPDDPTDDLTPITLLKLIMKADVCVSDADTSNLVLTSANPTQISITSHTAAQILATAWIPASALAAPYSRVWRVDAYVGTTKRTALYGPVTLVDL